MLDVETMETKFVIMGIFLALLASPAEESFENNSTEVYTISYVRSFRPDLVDDSMGCGFANIAYSTYTYPSGLEDALNTYQNPGQFQLNLHCKPKNIYAKVFGYEQDYDDLKNGEDVANNILQRVAPTSRNIIIDWKKG